MRLHLNVLAARLLPADEPGGPIQAAHAEAPKATSSIRPVSKKTRHPAQATTDPGRTSGSLPIPARCRVSAMAMHDDACRLSSDPPPVWTCGSRS